MKRNFEKYLFFITLILSVVFLAIMVLVETSVLVFTGFAPLHEKRGWIGDLALMKSYTYSLTAFLFILLSVFWLFFRGKIMFQKKDAK